MADESNEREGGADDHDGPVPAPEAVQEPQAPPEKGPEEQPPPEKGPEEQPPPEKGPEEQPPPEKGPEEQPPPEKGPEEQPPPEKGPEEQPPPEEVAASPAVAVELAEEPDYPPPNSVPRPPPPVSLKVYGRPVVEEVTPSRGPVLGETKVTLVGSNLLRVSIVRIGGIIAQTVGADEPRELRVLTPGGSKPGDVDITVENPHAPPTVLAKAFHYEALPPPRIVSVAPDHVATRGRTELTVMGEGFVKGTVVLFDGKPVENARFVSATTIDVTAPPGDHGKLVDVSVKNPDGATAVVRRAFVYDERYG